MILLVVGTPISAIKSCSSNSSNKSSSIFLPRKNARKPAPIFCLVLSKPLTKRLKKPPSLGFSCVSVLISERNSSLISSTISGSISASTTGRSSTTLSCSIMLSVGSSVGSAVEISSVFPVSSAATSITGVSKTGSILTALSGEITSSTTGSICSTTVCSALSSCSCSANSCNSFCSTCFN